MLGALLALACPSPALAQSGESEVRRGVVTAMTPVAKKGGLSSGTMRRLGASLGRTLGTRLAGSEGYRTGNDLGADLGESMASTGGGRHLLEVRLDGGGDIALETETASLTGVSVGARVRIIGSGRQALVRAE
ncbi:hypothetical protein [Stenotrophomonas sp. MMGLT7]|uniref:hypothetical protein n=1 Tax=Stenotrophomonas sp. MMGLT7 TaxID=2901227 RepID=UPI001E4B764E|nr:hypothetical protein [Stenotrophomonas sp. MMGLT7]MCD7098982.1 hypothetical protein [Stenotrophomonas sp. MMGLT7]